MQKEPTFYDRVYEVVRRVPPGQVVAYGWISSWLGSPRGARAVGYALAAAPDGVPWQRVINSQGEISVGGRVSRPDEQLLLLRREGVKVSRAGKIDLERYGFQPSKRLLSKWFREKLPPKDL